MGIKIKSSQFYYPETKHWILETFGVDYLTAVLYQTIINKRFFTWSIPFTARVFHTTPKNIQRKLDLLTSKGAVEKVTIQPLENNILMRTVYVAKYLESGERSRELVEELINQGLAKIYSEYQ